MTAGIANAIPAIFVSGGLIMPATRFICPSGHEVNINQCLKNVFILKDVCSYQHYEQLLIL